MDDRWQTHRLYLDAAPSASVEPLLNTEWTLTNGTGAYAMGTVAGCNTRRYHGLLVAAQRPPVGRLVALNQMWEQVILTGAPGTENQAYQVLDFATLAFHNDGQRLFTPRGHEMLRQFDRGLAVQWSYTWGAIGFERQLILHWKQQAATIRYRVTGLDEADLVARLRVHPMVTLRDYHALRHRGDSPAFEVVDHGGSYLTVGQGEARIALASSHGAFRAAAAPGGGRSAGFEPHWWERVWYGADADRGQEDREDYFVPAMLETEVEEGVEVAVTVALGDEPVEPVMDAGERESHLMAIEAQLTDALSMPRPRPAQGAKRRGGRSIRHTVLPSVLAIASDDFVVDRRIGGEDLSTVIAGYPWFSDWGRDTFIALPGLLLCTGRHREARQTLRAFADAISGGLVPNRFDDYQDQAAHYNTVDASLWFVHAAVQYLEVTNDLGAWRDWLAAACLRIVDAYIAGTEYGIVMDTDGLIVAGNEQTQLTWMDAACGGVVFTPRFGKAVEINALWFNVLAELSRWLPKAADKKAGDAKAAERFTDAADTCLKLCDRVKRSFNKVFWNQAAQCLFDTVWTDASGGGSRTDASIRPNQVFAVSLPNSPLSATKQKQVLTVLAERLVTPVGLRTLPTDDPRYHGRYTGEQFQRDEAYHQGTVWAWLMGPYAEAVLRAGKFTKKARQDARAAVDPLVQLITTDQSPCSLGQLHEIYEADQSGWIAADHPTGQHRPVGCVAQAWSVAELIRALWLIERA